MKATAACYCTDCSLLLTALWSCHNTRLRYEVMRLSLFGEIASGKCLKHKTPVLCGWVCMRNVVCVCVCAPDGTYLHKDVHVVHVCVCVCVCEEVCLQEME